MAMKTRKTRKFGKRFAIVVKRQLELDWRWLVDALDWKWLMILIGIAAAIYTPVLLMGRL